MYLSSLFLVLYLLCIYVCVFVSSLSTCMLVLSDGLFNYDRNMFVFSSSVCMSFLLLYVCLFFFYVFVSLLSSVYLFPLFFSWFREVGLGKLSSDFQLSIKCSVGYAKNLFEWLSWFKNSCNIFSFRNVTFSFSNIHK